MNSRERVKLTLEHKNPDRIPIDLGSTNVTGIAASALHRLRKGLKLEQRPVKVHDPFLMLGMVEDDVRKALHVDIIGVGSPTTKFGYRNDEWKPWVLPDGTDVLVGKGFTTREDTEGNIYAYPQGDINAVPSAKLPKGGFYFDNIIRQEPVNFESLKGREDFSEQYKLFSEEDLKYYEKVIADIYNNTEYAIVGNFGGGSLGDLALLPGPGLKRTPGIRQIDEWYAAHLLYPDYIMEVYDYQTEIALKNLEMYKHVAGDKIQVIVVSGTDFGTQRSEFISPELFRKIYKPYYKKMNSWIHRNTSWKTFYHCCGSIVNLIDDFVDMEVDILNPVQCSAAGMRPEFLKEKYGSKLVFWGGAVDTQRTLPFGTPDEVEAEVIERLKVFSEDGGYVFNAVHNIQALTPVENIMALFETVAKFNEKRLG